MLKRKILLRLLPTLVLASVGMQSCFTGVESTKPISLGKDYLRLTDLSAEDKLLSIVSAQPSSEWMIGKPFYVTDDRAALNFDPQGLPYDPTSIMLGGSVITFYGTEDATTPDGAVIKALLFRSPDRILRYLPNQRSAGKTSSGITSSEIPMLIDLDMVDMADSILRNKRLWTRTRIWYDSRGEQIPGLKFEPVTIDSVRPGDMTFPLRVYFSDANGRSAYMRMNFGASGTESRSFGSLFCLQDPRIRHSSIDPEVWDEIRAGGLRAGMTKEECRLSLGQPESSDQEAAYSKVLEIWKYPGSVILYFEDGILTRFRK